MQVSFTSLAHTRAVGGNRDNALKVEVNPRKPWQAGGRKDEIPTDYSKDTFDKSHHNDDTNNSAGMRVH